MNKKAIVVLADGFEEIEAVTIIDILRRGGIDVCTAGLTRTDAKGAHGITVIADITLAHLRPPFDAIVLPGGQPGTANLALSSQLLDLLRQTHDRGLLCAAICAAPTVLAKAGLLEQRVATCYPGNEPQMSGAVISEKAVVIDGNIITGKAAGTAMAFALALVGYLADPGTAKQTGDKLFFSDNVM